MTIENNKSIILGITGGIAAYKAAELVRLLIKANYDVQVVMTDAACQFITPITMQALSGKPVYTNMWESSAGNGMAHIELSRQVDAILIAPASADFIAKLVHGGADDLLSTLCLARDCPLLVAPAMNKQMWENPSTQRNIAQCITDKISVLGPDVGEQACGENGAGRMLEPEALLDEVNAYFTPKMFTGKNVLITAGATLEMIDPVRGITNISSGKMGYAIAQTAANMGATVTLVHGVSSLPLPNGVNAIAASNSELMYQTVMREIKHQDIFISVAAVADYSPDKTSNEKIKKNEASLTLQLKRNKDILAEIASLPNAPFCVGFAAETQNLLALAKKKRKAKSLPLIVANLISESMGKDEANITLLDNEGSHILPKASKESLATAILKHIHQLQKAS